MGEQTYQELLAYLQNNGKSDWADALFKLFVRNRKLSSENSAYKQALQAGITVHIHNEGQQRSVFPPKVPTLGGGTSQPLIGPLMNRAGFNEASSPFNHSIGDDGAVNLEYKDPAPSKSQA
jgi:hypothetical protein